MNMKFFILGHNPKLSEAEVISYFASHRIKAENWKLVGNSLLVDSDFSAEIINELGGVIAIGRILVSGNKQEITDYIKNNEIYFSEEVRFTYSLIGSDDEILQEIREKFKHENLKARYLKENGDTVYLLAGEYFGIVEKFYSNKEDEIRDMKKPVRRAKLAIPPRLARILVNLSQAGNLLLDPFCGIGTIMQEALLQGINVIGVDIDRRAIENAKRNLKWLEMQYKTKAGYNLVREDSRKFRLKQEIDGIATEPSFGSLLRKIPSREQAVLMVRRFEYLIIGVLNHLKRFLKRDAKIAFTLPLIKVQNARIGCDIRRICKLAGLKVYNLHGVKFPIQEFRDEQIVGREICVLER